ncbi:tetratricopeptide repeat protein [bacterium]|nr:MAG: tetratricopeptide repeat protein [bacterium]
MKKNQIIVFAILILLVSFVSLLPSLSNGFVGGDDSNYVLKNPLIRDLSWRGVRNIFTSMHLGLYKPLTMLSFALEYHYFKLGPYTYHLTNLILHLLNALLVFWLILLVSRKAWVSFIVALLFGIHPMHVESVAWVSERKDVLYSLFFLSGIIAYIYSLRDKKRVYHYLTFFLFILTLLVKPMGLTFPFILLLCDYILYIKLDKDNLKSKAVFFITSGIFLGFTLIFASGYASRQPSFGFFDGIFIANYALLFYLAKIILPLKLCVLYPYPHKNGNLLPFIFLISPLFLLFLTSAVIFSRRYTRKIIFGSLFFLICVFPVIQLVPTGGYAIVADRYAYLSSIGIFYIIAEFIAWLYQNKSGKAPVIKALVIAGLAMAIVTLSFLSWNRCKVWRGPDAWFDDALKSYPSEIRERLRFYREKIGRNHGSPEDYNNLAVIYGELGSHETAISLCQKAIEINPNSPEAYNNLSAAYGFSKDFDKSIEFSQKSLALDPRFASAYNNLAVAYYYKQQYALAIQNIDTAIRLGFKADSAFLKELNKYRK